MDLVVGGTGVVGSGVALRLAREGRATRALVRGGASRAEAGKLRAAGAGIVDGDLTRPGTLDAACAGARTVVCTATSMPHGRDDGLRRVDLDGTLALIDAAERADVRRFVYVSYSGNIDVPSPFHTAKRSCEARLLDSPMEAVILRPSFFAEVWLSPHLGFDPAGRSARIYGTGEAWVSYISAGNVADFAAALTREEAEGDRVLELGGPEAITQLDAVRMFEESVGAPFALERVPLEALEAGHAAATEPLPKTFAALSLAYARGDEVPAALETAARYGVRLRSVAEYARSFRADA